MKSSIICSLFASTLIGEVAPQSSQHPWRCWKCIGGILDSRQHIGNFQYHSGRNDSDAAINMVTNEKGETSIRGGWCTFQQMNGTYKFVLLTENEKEWAQGASSGRLLVVKVLTVRRLRYRSDASLQQGAATPGSIPIIQENKRRPSSQSQSTFKL
jgi:hypothetical protein